jgi:hypothetical protein
VKHMSGPCILLLLAGGAHAQLQPPERLIAPVANPSMTVIDRGAQLELLPTQRAIPTSDSAGHTVHQLVAARAESPIGPQQLGVVFNHAMQQQGYITGEIAFKMKAGHSANTIKAAHYPAIQKVTAPEVYVLATRTPSEFMAVLERLQSRVDLDWVEPTVIYGPGTAAILGN